MRSSISTFYYSYVAGHSTHTSPGYRPDVQQMTTLRLSRTEPFDGWSYVTDPVIKMIPSF